MLYRICTENKNKERIAEVVADYYDCFSIFTGEGYWRGVAEKSLCIEIDTLSSADDRPKICELAGRIKRLNSQEAVLVQEIKAQSTLV